MKLLIILLNFLFLSTGFSQNLTNERISKLIARKRSIYLSQGIFHHVNGEVSNFSLLKGVRSSYVKSRGFERIVFDFNSNKPPKIYGHISNKKKKVYLDFIGTGLDPNLNMQAKVRFASNIDFFNLDKNNVSVEVSFKGKLNFEVFYLNNPGRIILDIKQ